MNRRRPSRSLADRGAAELELVWRGKYDARGERVTVAPRPVRRTTSEVHGSASAPTGELVWGDNLDALDGWLERHRGAVDLAYIDPPFSTGSDFPVLTRVRDGDGRARVLAQPAYTDRWPGGAAAYLAMLAPRLERIHALLADHGSLYVHVDPTLGHAVRLLLDEIFGAGRFQREIIWRIGWVSGFKTRARNWIRNHDTILFYAKDPARMRFNKLYVPHPAGYVRRAGAAAKAPGMAIDDVWNAGSGDLALVGVEALDSIQIKSFSREKTGYATQKNESLLRRIVAASSNPGDLVLDAFSGAGTTAVVAAGMGRRFLASDVGDAAIQLTRTRLRRSVPDRGWSLVRVQSAEIPAAVAVAAVVESMGPRRWRVLVGPSAGRGRRASPPASIPGPRLALELAIDERGHLSIALTSVALAATPTVAAEVRAAVADGVDPVLECAIDWDVRDDTLRPSTVYLADPDRDAERRFVSPAPIGAGRIAVQVVDVAFGCTRVDLELSGGKARQLRATWR